MGNVFITNGVFVVLPIPTSLLAMKTPMTLVKSSGADPPAAMNVAPATSGLIPS